MDLTEKIKKEFPEINKCFFEKEDNLLFLKVETPFSDLDKITEISRKINDFIDKIDDSEKQYFLDIYSPGTEGQIEIKAIDKYISKNIKVTLKKPIKTKEVFEGQLLEVNEDSLLIKWNAKGQFRKQIIEFENILQINSSAKIKKIKKVKNEKRRV